MEERQKEEWMRLCEQAAYEQDPEKLMALVQEINRLLDEKHQRLQKAVSPTEGKAKSNTVSS